MRAAFVVGGILLLSIALCLDLAHQIASPEIEEAINENIKSQIIWQPDSPQSVQDRFRGTSNDSNIYVRFYLLSISNLDDVRQGHIPILNQLGPYTFIRHRQKLDVEFNADNSTVSFNDYTYLIPVPDLTNGSLDDPVTTLNIPLIGAIEAISSSKTFSKVAPLIRMIAKLVESWGDSSIKGIFITRSVQELLFGYEDPLLKRLSFLIPGSQIDPTFALAPNATLSEQRDTLYTGHRSNRITFNDISNLKTSTAHSSPTNNNNNKINLYNDDDTIILGYKQWHGINRITSWRYPYIETVKGTDGTQFKPNLYKNSDGFITVWVPEIFRSIRLLESSDDCGGGDMHHAEKTTTTPSDRKDKEEKKKEKTRTFFFIDSIPVLRFRPDPVQHRPDPRYFQEISGLFNITAPMARGPSYGLIQDDDVVVGPPLFLSLPGYCGVDKRVGRGVKGIECDPRQHDIYIDVEPSTGMTLRAMKTLMLSSWYGHRYTSVDSNIADDTFLPIFWAQEYSEATAENTASLKKLKSAEKWHSFLEHAARPLAAIIALFAVLTLLAGVLVAPRVPNSSSSVLNGDEEGGGGLVMEADEADRLLDSGDDGRGRMKRDSDGMSD